MNEHHNRGWLIVEPDNRVQCEVCGLPTDDDREVHRDCEPGSFLAMILAK